MTLTDAIANGILQAVGYLCLCGLAGIALWRLGILVCFAFSKPNRLVIANGRLIISDRSQTPSVCTGKYFCPCDKCREPDGKQ